ncbi:MAG: YceI family protein [Gemmatimonadetes bacterium]|nr:YceI family protein [Gemmatimonadota bacterium]MBI3568545.1 YceI family protein [Gemmatimonadota bacterium]
MSSFVKVLALMLLPAVAREQGAYVRDEAHSQINFSASSRMIDAQGYWDKWEARIAFDPTNIDKTTIAIDIDAKSINTRVQMRDNHLRSNAFFATDSFPTITFVSKSVHATGTPAADLSNTKLIITGDLTIRGVTKTISVPATMVFFDKEHNVGRVKGTFTVLRKDYNVGFDPPGNPVENEVGVQFDIAFKGAK